MIWDALSPGRAQNENGGKEAVRVLKPNIKFEHDSKQMLAAAQLGVTAPISPINCKSA